MNTSALKTFAPAVRRQLIEAITRKLDYVLTARTPELLSTYAPQVAALNKLAGSDRTGLIERVAYTWFNRLAALRFLDAKGWHPFRARVLTPATPDETQPELLKLVRSGTLPDELAPFIDSERMNRLLDGALPSPDPQGEVYRLLVLAACRFYHDLLPDLFEKLDDATELLLPDDLLTEHSIVQGFRTEITDEDCAEVEILGWLYQFYISERKDTVMARKKAVPTEDIPSVTQLFTPHWIVRYLVENSLGRLWLLNRPTSHLREHMPYYIEGEPETDFLKISKPEEIRLLDPAAGSGHMLTYSFDLLFKIYAEEGYAPSEIPGLILRHNLYGLEICPRAAQLAQFALVCKAREKSRRFFQPEHIVRPAIIELEDIRFTEGELPLEWLMASDQWPEGETPNSADILHDLNLFTDTKTIGSLLHPKLSEQQLTFLKQRVTDHWQQTLDPLLTHSVRKRVLHMIKQAEVLSQRYHVVVANPPYMGFQGMNNTLKLFTKAHYDDFKSDLFSVFIRRSLDFVQLKGFLGLMTPFTWMFLSSYEQIRSQLVESNSILSLIRPEYHAFFDSAFVPICAFIIHRKYSENNIGCFIDLNPFVGAEIQAEKALCAIMNVDCNWRFNRRTSDFTKIPGIPIAYEISASTVKLFETSPKLSTVAAARQGLITGDNEQFLRFWHEVEFRKIGRECKTRKSAIESKRRWFPHHKGGAFRKWYGNHDFIVDWENDGERIRGFVDEKGKQRSRPQNLDYYFKPAITWTSLTVSSFNCRISRGGFVYDAKGPLLCPLNNTSIEILGSLLNSKVANYFLKMLAPTMDYNQGPVGKLPFKIPDDEGKSSALKIAKFAEQIATTDWDSFETSWDFLKSPLIRSTKKESTLESCWLDWKENCDAAILRLKDLETNNNRLWINAYGLETELTPEAFENEITLARADLRKDIAAFLSYAVGCMMGRYSLDAPGLILADAGGTVAKYLVKVGKSLGELSFAPDEDAIIPMLDGDWFDDDIVARTREFLRATFGDTVLRENIRFLEESLGKDLRKYFLTDFYKDHLQTYKKRPIYWLVQSPKKGFSVLIYLHRYTRDTLNIVLNRYLRPYQEKLRERISHMTQMQADDSASTRDKTAARKEADNLLKILHECEEWERDTLLPLAQQRIELDLDDGVKVNYLKLYEALAPIPGLATKEKD